MKLRRVRKGDIKDIFMWRNSPEIRSAMFVSELITWESHVSFWNKRFSDKKNLSFIIEFKDEAVGVVRLDKRGNFHEIDIFVKPEAHGKGVGTEAIKYVIDKAKTYRIKKLVAKVRPENIASKKMFEKNNFKAKYLYYEREL
ncbi:MAG: GNAT family N-acetyltransferase [Candidatus Aenigmarchaeota archaeon]|nr:GNAT family N-acetyltransferase [Candidatus Aenigmarchaeota archaeon]